MLPYSLLNLFSLLAMKCYQDLFSNLSQCVGFLLILSLELSQIMNV